MQKHQYNIRLKKPARYWDDGLPLGNGRLGAMVMGKVEEETLFINEETLWYGADHNRKNQDTVQHLEEIRRLLREGRVQQAQFLARLSMTSAPKYCNPYQPAGDLKIFLYNHKHKTEGYERILDLNRGLARVHYRMDGCEYEREYLVSHAYQVLAVRIRAKGKQRLTLSVNMNRKPFEEHSKRLDDNTVCNYGQCGPEGIRYFTGVRLTAEEAEVQTIGDFAYVENAREAVIYLAAATDFMEENEKRVCLERLNAAEQAGYETIRERHLQEYCQLFDRMELTLGVWPGEDALDAKAADEVLEALRQGQREYEVPLTEVMFHYARYLMISSSYDCIMPSNLQGIWNGEYAPPWQCELTININEQMNYWMAEKCNLPECHMPLFGQLERMVEKGRRTARELYGCEGFCAHHNTNIWANTDPEGIFEASPFWPMGAAWLSLHLYEHYAYTLDGEFLKERALPVMWEAILFFRDYLSRTPEGDYVTGPSVSPENTYRSREGQQGALCMGPSMDIQILRQLTQDYLAGMEAAGQTEDHHERVQTARDILEHLPPQRLTADGRLMEWQEEYEELEPGHRHISHLFALHPGTQITRETPETFAAARKTLEKRLANGGGHTGWSRAWIICFWSRLMDGKKVEENIGSMLRGCIKDNLLDTHPPFQIDGNFGLAEGILESLAQSHGGKLVFLPALPESWSSGRIRGMVLKGAIHADLDWEDGKLIYLALTTKTETEVEVVCGDFQRVMKLEAGEKVMISIE